LNSAINLQQIIYYIAHHTLTVLLHLAKSKLLILLCCKHINANAVIFGHENKAVFTHLIFVDPGIKINGEHYADVLLKQEMMPDIYAISGDFFIFQQDSAPTGR